ncbi:MAG: hypothetical protein DMD50_04800 [Gemmatimonadetes bacterium]|nr:MAG: hypothetical protein DMD50_04800 [Gemmatimonadota bacterium]
MTVRGDPDRAPCREIPPAAHTRLESCRRSTRARRGSDRSARSACAAGADRGRAPDGVRTRLREPLDLHRRRAAGVRGRRRGDRGARSRRRARSAR